VEDQFAGMQGKCPTCGTIITFGSAPPPIFAIAPSPAEPPPVFPAASPAAASAGPGFATAAPSPTGTFSLAGLAPIASIPLPAGRFGGAGAGLWIGFLAAIGIVAAFVALSILRPLEWPYVKALGLPPVLQRYGALVVGQAGALLLGFLYLLITLAS